MIVRELLMNETLPRKNFFKLSEVAILLNVKPHEIHYWEAEFPQVRSQKSPSGQRIYRKEDVVLFSAIKHLLYDRKFTVAGARRVLSEADTMIEEFHKKETIAPACVSVETNRKSSGADILEEAASMLGVEEEYHEATHEIYQDCASELEEAHQDIEPHCAGEMINAAINEQKEKMAQIHRIHKLEQEKAMALLMASKESLCDVLHSLEKIKPSDFWRGF